MITVALKLHKAVNDARAIGDTLKRLGFSVLIAEGEFAKHLRA
jgi:hypothetical protein